MEFSPIKRHHSLGYNTKAVIASSECCNALNKLLRALKILSLLGEIRKRKCTAILPYDTYARINGFDPRKALVVGDSLTSDMRGGICAGIDTCWYNPKNQNAPDDLPITYIIHTLQELPGVVFGA